MDHEYLENLMAVHSCWDILVWTKVVDQPTDNIAMSVFTSMTKKCSKCQEIYKIVRLGYILYISNLYIISDYFILLVLRGTRISLIKRFLLGMYWTSYSFSFKPFSEINVYAACCFCIMSCYFIRKKQTYCTCYVWCLTKKIHKTQSVHFYDFKKPNSLKVMTHRNVHEYSVHPRNMATRAINLSLFSYVALLHSQNT